MCEPMTMIAIASTTLAATQSVVGYMGASKQAAETNAAYSRNADRSLVAFRDDIEAANLSTMTAQEGDTQRRMAASSDGIAARGATRAASGERGIGGLTAAALQRDLGFQEGSNIAAINRNSELDRQRHRLSTRGARDATMSRINSAQRSAGPSLLSLGADLGAAAINGYTMHSNLRANAAAGAD